MNHLRAEVLRRSYEQAFGEDTPYPVRYMRFEAPSGRSDILVIVFSSCTHKGVKARYNYVRTLDSVDATRVFIIDDYGADGRGCYYLGKGGDRTVYDNTVALIGSLKSELNPAVTLYCGSSKGGHAALNFGVADSEGVVIAGSPQYLLDDYFETEFEKKNGNEVLAPYVIGEGWENDAAALEELNDLVRGKVRSGLSGAPVYLCYGLSESLFSSHFAPLKRDLEGAGRQVVEEVHDYSSHGDISKHFPSFLLSSIEEITGRLVPGIRAEEPLAPAESSKYKKDTWG